MQTIGKYEKILLKTCVTGHSYSMFCQHVQGVGGKIKHRGNKDIYSIWNSKLNMELASTVDADEPLYRIFGFQPMKKSGPFILLFKIQM